MVVLSGSNTFTGITTINAGTLRIAASERLLDAGALTISGGTFDLGAHTETVAALTLNSGAYMAEIVRAGIQSISHGQLEAAVSSGLNYLQRMRHIILPQAARVAIAPTVGFLVQVVKGTALASVIGFIELTKAGTMITNATFKPFVVYSMVGLIYFALCYPISAYARSLERKMHVYRH
jgi:polar amino acid transport system permease protein